jgi:hypothetical protein
LATVQVEQPDPCGLQPLIHHAGDPLEQLVAKLRVGLALAARQPPSRPVALTGVTARVSPK